VKLSGPQPGPVRTRTCELSVHFHIQNLRERRSAPMGQATKVKARIISRRGTLDERRRTRESGAATEIRDPRAERRDWTAYVPSSCIFATWRVLKLILLMVSITIWRTTARLRFSSPSRNTGTALPNRLVRLGGVVCRCREGSIWSLQSPCPFHD
jgi:hypothetical protein